MITLALVNGRVWTGNAAQPEAEASPSPAIGSSPSARTRRHPRARRAAPRRSTSAGGFVVPGFIDAHVHFLDGGFRLAVGAAARRADARGIRRAHQGVRRDRAGRAPGSPAATGTTRCGAASCRAATGSTRSRRIIPVWVNRLDGHMALANSAALRAAGVTRRGRGRRRRRDRARRRGASRPACSRTTRWTSSARRCRRRPTR